MRIMIPNCSKENEKVSTPTLGNKKYCGIIILIFLAINLRKKKYTKILNILEELLLPIYMTVITK